MDTKDRSIMLQVAAKIAADLTPHTLVTGERVTPEEIGNLFVRAFSVIADGMFDGLGEIEAKQNGAALKSALAPMTTADIAERFNAVIADEPLFQIRVAGKQHGDLPSWLTAACAATGTMTVFDNRDKLPANPKRPWFVDADNRDNAFWPPRKG